MVEEQYLSLLLNGGTIGTGATAGAFIIVKIVQGYFKDVQKEIKAISIKFDEILRSHEVTKARLELEVLHITSRIENLEKSIDRIKNKGD